MKIRSNYVSNSSSSSFLIIYKDESDFNKFREFKNYEIFIKDLKESNEEYGLNFIESSIDYYLFYLKEKYKGEDSYLDFDYYFENTPWFSLPSDFNYRDDNIYEKIGILRKKKEESDELSDKSYELLDKSYDSMNNKEEAKKFFDFLKEKGYIVKAIRYEDHTDEGCYMEHYFMPFLKACPEGDFYIYCINGH